MVTQTETMARHQRDRAQRRADLFREAERVFAEKGYHPASMEEIARAAGYGTGTVYLYFKDKETLYAELVENKFQELFGFVEQRVGDADHPLEALKRMIRARLEFFDRNRPFFEIYVRERVDWSGRMKGKKSARVRRAFQEHIELLARWIQAGQQRGLIRAGDSRQFAVALLGMMVQLTRDWLRRESDRPLAGKADYIVDLFLNGMQQKGDCNG